MDSKLSLKGAWLRHVTHFKFGGPIHISGMAEARAVKFCTPVGYIKSYQKNEKSPPNGTWLWSCDLFKFSVSSTISPKWLKLETSNFVNMYTITYRVSLRICKLYTRNCLKYGWAFSQCGSGFIIASIYGYKRIRITEPVALKYGKLAAKYPSICGYFYSVR